MVAIDHTFEVVKNYQKKDEMVGASCCFTCNHEHVEIVALGIVSSTTMNQVAHLVTSIVKKCPTFRSKVIYTNMLPNSDKFWSMMFGTNCKGHLGLFHCMKKILDTLDNKCKLYWEAVVDPKYALYEYDPADEEKLLTVMKNGTLSKHSKKHTNQDIKQLHKSCNWKSTCNSIFARLSMGKKRQRIS